MQFNQNDLKYISEKASTIVERLGSKFTANEPQEEDALVNTRLEQWCQVVARGDWKQFEKRLAWDGLDLKTARSLLGCVYMSDAHQLPSWTETLNGYLKLAPSLETLLEDVSSEKNRFLEVQKHIPFQEVLSSFIYGARSKLSTQVGYELISDVAHANLERSLLQWLACLCEPSISWEFSIFCASRQSSLTSIVKKSLKIQFEQYYQDFIKELLEGKLLEFFREYPVLARLLATLTDLWVEVIGEFISRLVSDLPEIQKTFQAEADLGKVIAVQSDLSDHHQNGRSVMLLTFASGLKLVYKPKDLGIEQAYIKLLAWLNQHGAPLSFKLFKVFNRSTHGWVEFIEALPCKDQEETKRYYQRAGALLCLVHILGSTDLHYENIIACGEHPVLIDLETLMHPRLREVHAPLVAKGAEELAYEQLYNSVMRTALLPLWQFGESGQAYDASGLGGVSQLDSSLLQRKWHRMDVLFEQQNTKIQAQETVPDVFSLDNKSMTLGNYQEEIVDGFQKMYRFLLNNRQTILSEQGSLKALTSQSIRFVFRNTKTYFSILKQTLNPRFLHDGADRSIQLDVLSRAMLLTNYRPLYWPLLQIEKQSLEQMDIPLFTTRSDSDAFTISPNQTINNFFEEPSFNLVTDRLNKLNEQDLEQQTSIIQGSLYSRITDEIHRLSPSETACFAFDGTLPLTQEEIVQQVVMIAEKLEKQAIRSANGSATWLAPQYILTAQRFQLLPMRYGLFDGSCGVALFLAALEKVSPKAGFRDLIFSALQSLRQDLQEASPAHMLQKMNMGGAIGSGSIIYVLVRISQLLEESALLDEAKQLASSLTPDLISADHNFDIIAGASGAILGLLALYNTCDDSKILELAIVCGNHLLNNRVTSASGYRSWSISDGKMLTGFSHGAAGIAYALLRLYQVSGEATFLETAREAIAYERSVFIPNAGNWPDFRIPKSEKGFTCMCSWCHGAPGIGLARVGGLDILDTPEIRRDIEAAIKTTKQQKLGQLDHLCCGNLGRVEFLFTAAQKLSQPQLLETARKQAAQVLERAKHRRSFAYASSLSFNPGFFQGAAGIGYELLRLAYPDQLPSVLLWE